MTLFNHRLAGCRPTPLASYLKSLGILRLVSDQKDPGARGFWKDDTFHLVTSLSAEALRTFFLDEYVPTPVVGPWNCGSGFYEGDPREGLDAILASNGPRFGDYRETITSVLKWPELPPTALPTGELARRMREALGTMSGKTRATNETLVEKLEHDLAALKNVSFDPLSLDIEHLEAALDGEGLPKDATKTAKKVRTVLKGLARKAGKEQLANGARSRLSDCALHWVDTALLVTSDGELKYPPLLGSGGNEGRLDYTGAFMSALTSVVVAPVPGSRSLLENALVGSITVGLVDAAVGQFDPGRAGGFNQGPEAETKIPGANPWDIVLGIEGSVLWSSALTRSSAIGASQLSSPFTVSARAVGYSSASQSDAENARAELWVPIWGRPLTLVELSKLLSDGRAQLGRTPARDSLEFARAANMLGTARGIDSFVRYGLLKRRGDSYVAVPTGKVTSNAADHSRIDLVRGLDPILQEVDGFIRRIGKNVPSSLMSLRRRLDAAIYAVLSRGNTTDLQTVLETLGELEIWISKQDRLRAEHLKRPLGAFGKGLDVAWLTCADDQSVEFRIAAALASIPRSDKVGSLRANLTPIEPMNPSKWARGGSQRHWVGGTPSQRLANVLRRRLMDQERLQSKVAPGRGMRVSLGEIARFLDDAVDDSRIERLLFGLSLVRWESVRGNAGLKHVVRTAWPPHSFALLRLALAGQLSRDGRKVPIKAEAALVPLLLAGRLDDACQIATRRLRSSGLAPVGCITGDDPSLDCERLAAALLIPVAIETQSGGTNAYFSRILRPMKAAEEQSESVEIIHEQSHVNEGAVS